jgi:hypothetical protein
MKSALPAV